MTDTSTAGLCRLTIRAPSKAIDLAVPSDVPAADLLPIVLQYAGEEMEENGLDHEGWVLQRLGGKPLEDDSTLEALNVKDGEVLYLRPHSAALPEVRLDDIVDGIAEVNRGRLHSWSPDATRILLRGLVAATVLLALAVLSTSHSSAAVRSGAAVLTGLLLLAGAASASRAVEDTATGALFGFLAVPSIALAGWLVPGGSLSGPDGSEVLGARLLAAGTAGAGASVLALAVAAASVPYFLGAAVAAAATAVGGTLMIVFDLHLDAAASALAALAVVLGGFVPSLAFWFAGMRLPALPTTPGQLQEGIEPLNSTDVAARTELAGTWMTAIYGTIGLVCGGCLAALGRHPGMPETLTAVTLCALLLVHGRSMIDVPQRLTLVIPGLFGVLLLLASLAETLSSGGRLILVASLLAAAAFLAIVSWTVPGRRMLPYWGRAAELLHSVLAISLLPLTLWVLGVFAALRAIGS